MTPVGFLGLGLMGQPMALNLARAGLPLVVWNRTAARTEPLRALGATVAATPAQVFDQAPVVLLMLADASAVDTVLERGTPAFGRLVAGHTLVHLGTTSPTYSRGLADDLAAVGAAYVEAPVSGSRVPAEQGQLVAMLAGHDETVSSVRPLLAPMCAQTVVCGAVLGALLTKLAINHFLITTVTGLVESFTFARRHGLDLDAFRQVVEGGQLASPVAHVKIAKLLAGDLSAQAAARDVLTNNELVADAARAAGLATPVLDACHALFAETVAAGHGAEDMIAVLHSLDARSGSR
ncbi:NAD(P)-dependent oxidoreductase [Actinomycetospora sp. TBRC 11914]|uniref:NAD(P)-dependent oxidoreductase n=1 Tax=Actinomycetospora sp. TBRC 11914 TaxID=2729387 RepID=UPI00145D5785|nr:NAD(P)-dependent oxidoreductase [Actinomycetospora sp. TBRC 11914]NMO93194.1 NAD(P)-dependent oxidoreductase [Actinomycetospora sp. TBRC 11914]